MLWRCRAVTVPAQMPDSRGATWLLCCEWHRDGAARGWSAVQPEPASECILAVAGFRYAELGSAEGPR
jgi:hypothetical protein